MNHVTSKIPIISEEFICLYDTRIISCNGKKIALISVRNNTKVTAVMNMPHDIRASRDDEPTSRQLESRPRNKKVVSLDGLSEALKAIDHKGPPREDTAFIVFQASHVLRKLHKENERLRQQIIIKKASAPTSTSPQKK